MDIKKTLVMGIGNLLLSDDGAGVHAVATLADRHLPPWVEVLDVGTAFLDVLSYLENAEKVIVIDAVKANGNPGDIYRIPLEKCAPRSLDTLHNFDIFRMLALADNSHCVEVVVLGIEPERLEWGTELSPTVSQALPRLIDIVCKEIDASTQRF